MQHLIVEAHDDGPEEREEMKRCRFIEGQLVRKVRKSCLSGTNARGKIPGGKMGAVYAINHIDARGWIIPGNWGADCWPVTVSGFNFPSWGYICACQFDPMGEEMPAEIRKMNRVLLEVD